LANETTVKHVASKDHRVVYLASHGLIASDIGEPALMLSIPEWPTELDDGLLTFCEVAQFKPNAGWVVLSAGDKPGAQAMSGLDRAFFYASARTLPVTHWAVDSTAATRLRRLPFDIMKKDPTLDRAAMLAFPNLGQLESVCGGGFDSSVRG
jgi:CHAT domain-containing protein